MNNYPLCNYRTFTFLEPEKIGERYRLWCGGFQVLDLSPSEVRQLLPQLFRVLELDSEEQAAKAKWQEDIINDLEQQLEECEQ